MMDAIPDNLRGQPNWECADSWVGVDDLFALVQLESGGWMIYMPSPKGGAVEKRGPVLASNKALDVAIDAWQMLHGRKLDGDFNFMRFDWIERV